MDRMPGMPPGIPPPGMASMMGMAPPPPPLMSLVPPPTIQPPRQPSSHMTATSSSSSSSIQADSSSAENYEDEAVEAKPDESLETEHFTPTGSSYNEVAKESKKKAKKKNVLRIAGG